MKKSFTTVVSGAVVTLAMCGCNITTDGQAMTNTRGVVVDAEVADRLEHAAVNGEAGEIRLGAADRFGRELHDHFTRRVRARHDEKQRAEELVADTER